MYICIQLLTLNRHLNSFIIFLEECFIKGVLGRTVSQGNDQFRAEIHRIFLSDPIRNGWKVRRKNLAANRILGICQKPSDLILLLMDFRLESPSLVLTNS
jgi:hypothetical protein